MDLSRGGVLPPVRVRQVVAASVCRTSLHAAESRRCQSGRATSLHRLVQVAPLVGAEGVEGGHHQLAVKGPARQQPLGLFGVTGVAVFHEDLRGHRGLEAEAPVQNLSAWTLCLVGWLAVDMTIFLFLLRMSTIH